MQGSGVDLERACGRIADEVERLLEAHPSVPGAAVALRGPSGETAAVVRGVADPSTGEALTIDHAHRIASCTKSFVAATVVSLAVDGLVELDGLVIDAVSPEVAALLARYEHGSSITVRQVLQHRSGLVDHTMFPEFGEAITSTWTPQRQLAIAVERTALFDPGTAFSYSDSGYVLLGQLIEHVSGLPLAEAVRGRAGLDVRSMPLLHWELLEASPDGLVRTHQLFEGHDTHDWSPTFDLFGGGGLVSTLPDLCTWWSDRFDGAHGSVDVHIAGAAPSLDVEGRPFPGGDRVGLGMFGREVGGRTVWAHGGFWGLETGHVSDLGVSYALSITNRAAGIPAPHTIGTAVVEALTPEG
jgi:D-alanyl-D-alanine carboxypeptidase